MKKSIETIADGEMLKFFCVVMKDNIVGCGWYDTRYCLKTCKFYDKVQKDKIDKAKYWNRK